jgi:mono/diheme cytochrome c family protein
MRRSLPLAGAFLLAGGFCISATHQNSTQESSGQSQPATADYKVTPEDIARKNPVRPSPEGLAEARKVFKYDCAMCHGERGDGKGELVESMKLTMNDWRDPASLTGKTDGELFYIITKGKGKMPGDGDRQTEKLRWNLVNLARSFGAKGAAPKAATAAAPKT